MEQTDVLILFGSSSGTSEDAAGNFAKGLEKRQITSQILELDDWLDLSPRAQVVVVFVSSHGRGGAPFGAKKFRKLADKWMETEGTSMEGIHFALCGQGDSERYPDTYQENPKAIYDAFVCQGAIALVERGETDRRGDDQNREIEEWSLDTMEEIENCLQKTNEIGADFEKLSLTGQKALQSCG